MGIERNGLESLSVSYGLGDGVLSMWLSLLHQTNSTPVASRLGWPLFPPPVQEGQYRLWSITSVPIPETVDPPTSLS